MKKLIFILVFAMSWATGMATEKLTYLCDEWNVAEKITNPTDHMYQTFKWRLTTDTIINERRYVKIEKSHRYQGALREDENANIYIVYANLQQECLLYSFSAQIGDTLINTCLGNKIIVKDIRQTVPRTFVLDVEYDEEHDGDTYTGHCDVDWIEGIGYSVGTPIHYAYILGSIHDLDPDYLIICAYKDGEQVYMSEFAETFGCDYYLQEDTNDALPDIKTDAEWIYSNDIPYNILGQPVDETYHGIVIQNGKKRVQ